MRKCTGLRNRFRHGRSAYSTKDKSRRSDRYGQYVNGRQVQAESVAGHSLGPLPYFAKQERD